MLPHKVTDGMSIIFLLINLLSILTIISCDSSAQIPGVKTENIRTRLFKNKNGPCSYYQFRCQNDKCVERRDFCNGRNDCGDNSDERNCRTSSCRNGKGIVCGNAYYNSNCIPEEWECDGVKDCPDGRDERRCDTQAIIIMALACASAQPDSSFNREELPDYTLEIKKKQYRNGTVENIKTTALVLQALFASEPEPDDDNFDEEKAIKQILRSQEEDGSFGGLMNTYYILPVLSMSSLVNISRKHCSKLIEDENEGLERLKIQVGEKWNISYSIWIGDDKVLQRSLTLSVPANTSFYGIMEYAAGVDDKYKFEYNVRSRKPYIFALSGIMDDPEMETFWHTYYLFSNLSKISLISRSPADVIPKNNEHMLFWYRKVD
ncbi:uncharacterized protein CG3556 isoform X3 [Parasteatoda tepidariorum]|uniref:uncharacterized protein CG3556 isoform X3 n=1 Tax=Parasteatoda tepidariorum TaxID=114398 RepID=UPI0039BC263A